MARTIKIDNKIIGDNSPVFIVAELSANHNKSYKTAAKSILAAKDAGANAVKVQTFTPDTITLNSNKPHFKLKGTLWDKKKFLYDLYKEAYMPWEWQPKLKKLAESIGLIFFSSAFDKTAVDFLEKLDVPAYKIASLEITDIPLIEYIASKGKPVIISTGIAKLSDIKEAITACKRQKNQQIALLKCTSAYPAPFDEINLKTIPDMARKFSTVVGISDHTLGLSVSIASITLGAKIIEKHFILDKKIGGPDAAFSLEPKEFKNMSLAIREVEQALGDVSYELTKKMKKSREYARSLFVVNDVRAGCALTEQNIRSIRPSGGLPPKYFSSVINKKFKTDVSKGTPLTRDLIA